MTILVSYRGIPGRPDWASGACMVRAFRELCYDAVAYGNIHKSQTPIQQHGPWMTTRQRFEAHLWMECNDGDPQYTELLEMPTHRILWDFDTSMHRQFTTALAGQFHKVYVANRNELQDGWTHLPYGIDHHLFRPCEKQGGVAIIGTPFRERVEFAKAVDAAVVSGVYGDDYVKAIGALDIQVHHHDSGGDGLIVSRIWETLACGTALVTQDTPQIREFFDDGLHLRLYRDAEHCRAIIKELLEEPEMREDMAARGRMEVLAKHTWVCRARRILADMGRPV